MTIHTTANEIRRPTILKALRSSSPEELQARLMDKGVPETVVRQMFLSLPARRIRPVHRAAKAVVITAWFIAFMSQIGINFVAAGIGEVLRVGLHAGLAVTFLLGAKRLNPVALTWGPIWMGLLLAVGIAEVGEMPASEWQDPVFVTVALGALGLFGAGVLGMVFLRRSLFPRRPWLNLRPLWPEPHSSLEGPVELGTEHSQHDLEPDHRKDGT